MRITLDSQCDGRSWSSPGGGFWSIRCSTRPAPGRRSRTRRTPCRTRPSSSRFPPRRSCEGSTRCSSPTVTGTTSTAPPSGSSRATSRRSASPRTRRRSRDLGLDARPIGDSLDWDGLVHPVAFPRRHGSGAIAEALGAGERVRPRRPLPRRRHGLVRGGRGDDRALLARASPSSTPAAPRSSRAA